MQFLAQGSVINVIFYLKIDVLIQPVPCVRELFKGQKAGMIK